MRRLLIALLGLASAFSPRPLPCCARRCASPRRASPTPRRRPHHAAAPSRTRGTPAAVVVANAATKWLVVAAQTWATWARFPDPLGAFVTVGAIGAAFAAASSSGGSTRRGRTAARLVDPGMPSSHALVATFIAVGWCRAPGRAARRGARGAAAAAAHGRGRGEGGRARARVARVADDANPRSLSRAPDG